MTKPDFPRAALLAATASFAYGTDLNTISLSVAQQGYEYVETVQSAGFQCVIMRHPDTGAQIVDFRGTPVTCARDICDWLAAVDADVAFEMLTLPGGARVLARPYRLVVANYPRVKAALDLTKPIWITGHSLGAVSALIFAHLIKDRVWTGAVVVFAPFQFANAEFHRQTFAGREAPEVFGRVDDFAPGWDHLDARTTMLPTWHIGAGPIELVTEWPFYRESVGDHAVTAYAADLAALAEPVAA